MPIRGFKMPKERIENMSDWLYGRRLKSKVDRVQIERERKNFAPNNELVVSGCYYLVVITYPTNKLKV
jgi:hypothetical protein